MEFEIVRLLPEVIVILEALLTQAEQAERKRIVSVHLHKRDLHWYFSGEEIGLRQKVNAQLQELAAKGWLVLHWQKNEPRLLEAVDLVTEVMGNIYELIGKVPLSTKKEALYRLLLSQKACDGWFLSFLAAALTQLDHNQSPLPLSLADLQESSDLLYALAEIATLDQPILERTLSIQLFGNSKKLEHLRPAILSVLRSHSPIAAHYGDNDWAVLQAHHIYRPAKYIPLTGPIVLQSAALQQTETAQLHLDSCISSISLPDTLLRTADILSCTATTLVTVESLISFHELLFIRPLSVMVIFTAGFACSGLMLFLTKLHELRPDLPFLHWGNLDVQGLHVLAHLREHLPYVQSIGMDCETLKTYARHAQPLTASDQANLRSLMLSPQLVDCEELIAYLLEFNCKIEQEAVNALGIIKYLK